MTAGIAPPTGRPRLGDAALPGWRRRVFAATITWAAGYGAFRIASALAADVAPQVTRPDLLLFARWWSVALIGAAVVVVLGLRNAGGSRWWAVAGWVVASCLVLASALLLLDAVGVLLPGLGVSADPAGLARRAACLAGGLLVGSYTLSYQRHWRGACPACGRPPAEAHALAGPARQNQTQWWARAAAGAAVAGCLVRLAAQVAVGLDGQLLGAGVAVLLFEGGFLLAGTVLPLALASGWGRIVPRWIPLLGGRGVPRWLVLAPALGLGVGMTAYFGVTLLMILGQTLAGTRPETGSLPLWFFWIAVPAYLVWGLGLAIGGLAYGRATRPRCRHCLQA